MRMIVREKSKISVVDTAGKVSPTASANKNLDKVFLERNNSSSPAPIILAA